MTALSGGNGFYHAGEDHAALFAREYRQTAGRPPIIHIIGHGAYDNGLKARSLYSGGFWPIFAPLADLGFPLICADFGATPQWGNATHRSRLTDLIAFIEGTSGANPFIDADTTQYIFISISMGFLPTAWYCRDNPGRVAAAIGVIPVTYLDSIHDRNPNSYQAEINTAYGGSAPYETALAEYDPMNFTSTLASNGMAAKMRLFYHTDDTIVIPADVTGFASAVGCSTVSMGTGGHTPNVTATQLLTALEDLL